MALLTAQSIGAAGWLTAFCDDALACWHYPTSLLALWTMSAQPRPAAKDCTVRYRKVPNFGSNCTRFGDQCAFRVLQAAIAGKLGFSNSTGNRKAR